MILKLSAEELAPSVTDLLNKAITENTWTKHWKKGEWVPVFKKDDSLVKKNYKPITILPATDKVFEKLICNQLNKLFEPIFDPFMSAYNKTH